MPRYKKKNYKRKTNYLGTASKALSIALATKKLLNVEVKQYTTNVNDTEVSAAGVVYDLSEVPQGDTEVTRDGSSLKPKNLELRMYITGNSSAASNTLRLILFRATNENGTAPTMAQVLEQTSESAPLAIYSPKIHDKRYFTKILKDVTFTMNKMVASTAYRKTLTYKIPLDGHMTFTGTSTTKESGGLYLIMVSDQTAASNLGPAVQFTSRIKYYDN